MLYRYCKGIIFPYFPLNTSKLRGCQANPKPHLARIGFRDHIGELRDYRVTAQKKESTMRDCVLGVISVKAGWLTQRTATFILYPNLCGTRELCRKGEASTGALPLPYSIQTLLLHYIWESAPTFF